MAYNKIEALAANTAAIHTAWLVNNSATGIPTETQRIRLQKFSGFGGINEAVCIGELVRHPDEHDDIFRSHSITDAAMQMALLNLKSIIDIITDGDSKAAEIIADSISLAVQTSFYTPRHVIYAVGDAINHTFEAMGITPVSMLETSAGIGGFLPIASSSVQTTVAFEKDVVTFMILRALHPSCHVFNMGFETIDEVRDKDTCNVVPPAFDLVASNIPFGDICVYDRDFSKVDDDHRRATQKLHTYFFLKGLEQLEDGGILAFITTRGIADSKSNAYVRQWLVEHGDLLAAVRLPDNLFSEGYGKEVGSDLIIFQRNSHKAWHTTAERMFCETLFNKTIVIDGNVEQAEGVNRLLAQAKQAIYTHRRADSNQFGRRVINYYWRSGWDLFEHELRLRLMRDMERSFKLSTWAWGHDEERKRREREAAEAQTEKQRRAREKREQTIEAMRPLYDMLHEAFIELRTNERRDKVADGFSRDAMNEAYDEFFSQFGSLHKNETYIKHFDECPLMLSLEKREGKKWVKADIFYHPVDFKEVDEDERITPMDALSRSLNEFGRVKMRYMEQLTGMSEADLYEALHGEIFYYPEDSSQPLAETPLVWWHKFSLLNGNVIAKHRRAEEYRSLGGLSEFDNKALTDSIHALVDATPAPIAYEDIKLQLGQRWMPTKFYERFAQHLFQCAQFDIHYIRQTDTFSFEQPWRDRGLGGGFGPWAAAGESGFQMLEYALCDNVKGYTKTVIVTDPQTGERKKRSIPDDDKRREAQIKVDDMKDAYLEFMASDAITDAERQEIARIYNERFNCSIKAPFDGSMQTFPGLDLSRFPFDDLYQSQKDAIWMLKQNLGGICWHEVGGGKTMIMCITAYEMKRLGLANKPMIIGMPANIAQIHDTFVKAYPTARVLYPGSEFCQKNLTRIFDQIANNDWDCVILSHEQFKRLPQSISMQTEFINSEKLELEEVMRLCRHGNGISKMAWKGLERRKASLEKELQEVMDQLNDAARGSIDFSQMGIDFLCIDESQEFKNGAFSTKHERVKGIGKSDGNQKTNNLAVAIRTIQKARGRDLCCAFFSGTIISNAMTELYVVYKYLRPRALEQQGIYCFDAWASLFCKKVSDYDLTPDGEIKQMERFREYLNIPELSQFLREITDYRNADMINLDRPKANLIQDFVDPYPEQATMIERLKLFAASGNTAVLKLTEKELNYGQRGISFAVPNLARDISLDVRMLGEHQFHDHPDNKANRCAANIARYYRKYDAYKGTQFVFCDVSVDRHDGKWSLYREVKEKLVEVYGIPDKEIQFIQDHHSPAAKKKLFDDMNEGKVRVLFGATKSLGTGVNAQKRAVAAHHLDIPWKPSDMEQRNGRIVRSGNDVKIWGNNEVDIIVYGTNRTLDAYKMRLLQIKDQFVHQVCDGTVASRDYDDGAFDTSDDQQGARIPYAEFVALLSGNTDMLTKARLEAKRGNLERQRSIHNNNVRKAKTRIADHRTEIDGLQRAIDVERQDLADVRKFIAENGGISLIVNGAKDQSLEEQGRRLFALREEDHRNTPLLTIGSVCGLRLVLTTVCRQNIDPVTQQVVSETFSYNKFEVQALSGMIYACNKNANLGHSFEDAVKSFEALPLAIEKRIADNENGIRFREKDIEVLGVTASGTWSHAAELESVIHELAEVKVRIDGELKAREAAKKSEAEKATA